MKKKTLIIERLGWCCNCMQWILLEKDKDYLPDHSMGNGEYCEGSGYSYGELKYHIPSREVALQVAKSIIKDFGECLQGGMNHSLACGDGDNCAESRLRIAKALAEYVARTIHKKIIKENMGSEK